MYALCIYVCVCVCVCVCVYIYIYVWEGDSSASIATRYGLDGLGIECRWGLDFTHPTRPVLGPTQPTLQWVPGLSRE